MLCIVRLHQGKAVRKHGRPSQTPFHGRSCDLIWRPFVWVSINSKNRVQGCRTRFMALEVEPINFRFFVGRSVSDRRDDVAMAVGWDKRSDGPPFATLQDGVPALAMLTGHTLRLRQKGA